MDMKGERKTLQRPQKHTLRRKMVRTSETLHQMNKKERRGLLERLHLHFKLGHVDWVELEKHDNLQNHVSNARLLVPFSHPRLQLRQKVQMHRRQRFERSREYASSQLLVNETLVLRRAQRHEKILDNLLQRSRIAGFP